MRGGQRGRVPGSDRGEAGFGQRGRRTAREPRAEAGSQTQGLSCRHTGGPGANEQVVSSPHVRSSPMPQHTPGE